VYEVSYFGVGYGLKFRRVVISFWYFLGSWCCSSPFPFPEGCRECCA